MSVNYELNRNKPGENFTAQPLAYSRLAVVILTCIKQKILLTYKVSRFFDKT